MKNPLFDRSHIREYLLFGSIAAIAFTAFVIIFLIDNKYENMFLLFVGSFRSRSGELFKLHRHMPDHVRELLRRCGKSPADVDRFIAEWRRIHDRAASRAA